MEQNTSNAQKQRKKFIMLILAIAFAVMGIGKIWLWSEGTGNDFGLYLGIGFCFASIVNFMSLLLVDAKQVN